MAVDRFRAVALLTRGDLADAIEALTRVRRREDATEAAVARDEVVRGLLSVARGRTIEGVRTALRALSTCRQSGDLQGEAAALSILALCYRALGRHDEAVRFDEASPA